MSLADDAWLWAAGPLLLCLMMLGLYFGTGQRVWAVLGVLLGIIAAVLFGVSTAMISPREVLIADITAAATQFRTRDPAFGDHFSPTAGMLRGAAETLMRTIVVRDDLRLSDFQVTFTNQESQAVVHVRANATVGFDLGGGNSGNTDTFQPARFNVTYRREGDQWKIISAERLNPINGEPMGLM